MRPSLLTLAAVPILALAACTDGQSLTEPARLPATKAADAQGPPTDSYGSSRERGS
jgi:hypothetical protein